MHMQDTLRVTCEVSISIDIIAPSRDWKLVRFAPGRTSHPRCPEAAMHACGYVPCTSNKAEVILGRQSGII